MVDEKKISVLKINYVKHCMVNSKVSHLSAKNNQRNIKIKNVSFEKNGNRYKMKTKYLKPTSIYSVVYNLN